METNTDKRKTLIRRLLVEQLLPEEKQNLLKRNSVENEMKKQWKQFEDDPIKSEVKKRIWRNVQRRCEGKSDTLVHIGLGISSSLFYPNNALADSYLTSKNEVTTTVNRPKRLQVM